MTAGGDQQTAGAPGFFARFVRFFFGGKPVADEPLNIPLPAPKQTAEEIAAGLAVEFEGFSPIPYRDAVGVWTIGYGSTHDAYGQPVTQAHPAISEATARAWMVDDMKLAFADIQAKVRVPITTDETAALEDFIYNLGNGAFNGSTLLALINQGRFDDAAAEFDKWDHAGGAVLAGLLRRRQAETALFKKG